MSSLANETRTATFYRVIRASYNRVKQTKAETQKANFCLDVY